MQQEFRLLALLDVRRPEIRRGDSRPVDLVKPAAIVAEFHVICSGIGAGEGPTAASLLGPVNGRVQIRLEMHDGALALAVIQFGMIAPMQPLSQFSAVNCRSRPSMKERLTKSMASVSSMAAQRITLVTRDMGYRPIALE
jgi:hypothetical protein